MATVFSADSNLGTATLTLNNEVYLIRATYTTNNSTAFTFDTINSPVIFQDGGSVFNIGTGTALLVQSTSQSVTVNEGSSLVSLGSGIDMSANGQLRLLNHGVIKSTGMSSAIANAGNGSLIDNYGEISSGGSIAYTSAGNAGSTINNYGTIRTGLAGSSALVLGDFGDALNNSGTIFGRTNLGQGSDSLFNNGTMLGSVAISGGAGNKSITNTGFIGTDSLSGDAISLGSGNDLVFNFGRIKGTISFGDGDDGYQAYEGATLTSSAFGEGGADNLIGNDFGDVFNGGDDGDALTGYGGDDSLSGGSGVDTMNGGAGNDSYFVDNAGDVVNDSLGGGSTDVVYTNVGYALGTGSEVEFLVNNSGGGLALTGNEFAQTIYGHLTASDTLAGGGGADVLNGQGGSDTYNLGVFNATIVDGGGATDLVTSTITRSIAPFAGIERLTLLGSGNGTGNGLANLITGSAAANILDGGLGADILIGNAGNDTLIGSAGIDTLTGGANNDFFVFNAPLSAANRDIVTDFSAPLDTFRLENAVMTKLGAPGALKATAFFAGAAAHDADDRIVYNKATGILLYDSNGNLAGGATQLATLTTLKPTLTAADFVVI
jgi:hypothetical protein